MEALKTPLRLLVFTGLLPEANPPTFQKIRGIFFYYSNILFVFSTIIEIGKHFNDYSVLSGHLSISISPTSYLLKIMIFRTKQQYFSKIMHLAKKTEFTDYPMEMGNIVNKSVKLTKLFTVIYGWFCAIVITLYSLMPLLGNVDLPVMFSFNVGVYKSVIYVFQVFGE